MAGEAIGDFPLDDLVSFEVEEFDLVVRQLFNRQVTLGQINATPGLLGWQTRIDNEDLTLYDSLDVELTVFNQFWIGNTGVGAVTINVAGIPSAEAFGLPTLTLDLVLAGLVSAEAFGLPTVSVAGTSQDIFVAGIASAEAFGAPSVLPSISASGVGTAEALGAPTLTVNALPTGIASGEVLGAPAVTATLSLLGVATGEALGNPSVPVVISPAGILSSEAFGQPTVSTTAPADIVLLGIDSAEAFGLPTITLTDLPAVRVHRPGGIGGRRVHEKPEAPDPFLESLYRPYSPTPEGATLAAPAYARTAVSQLLRSALAKASAAQIGPASLAPITITPSDDEGIPDEVLLLALL